MNFKQYTTYTVPDFIQDENFIRWVKNAAPKDALFWTSFLDNYPHKRQEVQEAKALVKAMLKAPSQPKLSDKEKAAMLQQMQDQMRRVPQQRQQAGRRSIRSWRLLAAAVAVLLLGLATWTWFEGQADAPMITHTTTYGQRQSITLPDGSKVTLNANSSLTYADVWEEEESRKVWLQGEAFFEVAKKVETGQKFQVITKDLTVEVLGTIFNVNSHQEATKVFLEEGQVQLSLNGLEQTLLMAPGELIAYAESEKELPEKVLVHPNSPTSWKDGFLLFKKTPLREVLEKLEEIYGLSIEVKDTANYSRVIDTGLPVENLTEALSLLELTMGVKIRQVGDSYIID
ncbi:MAG: FecR domain-containing protein [Saprospiraceae bacterium]